MDHEPRVIGGLGLGASRYGAGVRGDWQDVGCGYAVVFALRSKGKSEQPSSIGFSIPNHSAAILSPSMPGSFEIETAYSGVTVAIPAPMIDDAIAARMGVATPSPRSFRELDLRSAAGAGAMRVLQFLFEEGDRDDSVLDAPAVASRLSEAFVHALVLALASSVDPSEREVRPPNVATSAAPRSASRHTPGRRLRSRCSRAPSGRA